MWSVSTSISSWAELLSEAVNKTVSQSRRISRKLEFRRMTGATNLRANPASSDKLPSLREERRRISDLRHYSGWTKLRLNEVIVWKENYLQMLVPVTVTPSGTVIAGFFKFQRALEVGQEHIECLVAEIPEEKAGLWFLRFASSEAQLDPFHRVWLASELDPELLKLSGHSQPKMTEHSADLTKLSTGESVNTRRDIAAATGLSEGTVSIIQRFFRKAPPQLFESVHRRPCTLHRAMRLISERSPEPEDSTVEVAKNNVSRTITTLLRAHKRRAFKNWTPPDLQTLGAAISKKAEENPDVIVDVFKAPVKCLFLSEPFIESLNLQGELRL
jgi:hypothetical protein